MCDLQAADPPAFGTAYGGLGSLRVAASPAGALVTLTIRLFEVELWPKIHICSTI